MDVYDLIKHLRKEQKNFFKENSMEASYYKVDLIITELDDDSGRIKKIIDEDKK